MKKIDRAYKVRNFHQAKWDEPIIFELSQSGERGVIPPGANEEVKNLVGDGVCVLPKGMKREYLNLPEIAQHRVLRHYLRLSQQTLGADLNIEIGQGTCTVKYSPKINEKLARLPQVTELHPHQDESTTQGILEIMNKTEEYMKEISGMDRFSFQSGGGSQAIMTMASLVRAYHDKNADSDIKDEIITTIYSHPSDAAAPALKGYKIIKIFPDENGYPDYEAFKEAVSERTAAFIVANPEDTGVFNTRVKEFTDLVHKFGGLCCYDQANANGLLGVTRAKEAGFDMCFFNIHKTFSAPHGCGGPACGAVGVVEKIVPFLPAPLVDFNSDENRYFLNYDLENSIGKVRMFTGVPQVVLKAYAWMRSLGAEGLYEVSKIAVLNNNYMFKKLMKHNAVDAPYIRGKQRIEQVRYTLEKLKEETGVGTGDIQRRMMDFGMHYWTSHHPYYIPEPFTLEPTETPSKEDLDEYIATLTHVIDEAYKDSSIAINAPYRSSIHKVDESELDDSDKWAITWRAYQKKAQK
ncbi:aminomethyl-transferring glycine dehydrogenase subunit GcvPB [Paraclostridium sordellii]|uniref:aminomethyl-transferring glycine dehydrogenase subunit GcvPB n=1 Tax=Paraclostridium sordellii TaxID=1505 RepID=UPI0005E7ED16|nr:aminomethyl-transferring glycine dehydrogenase subunit GcvPB [Paeniclostridium sordellii]CEP44091.1 glycine dehydrogenase [decarboxylating] subunit 2 [[Clostridium] sordellii] [Paeniclostridium sordellii]